MAMPEPLVSSLVPAIQADKNETVIVKILTF